eukprot:scaffold33196_cov73-Phaeocystis_antarctica.AAC.2
MTLVCTSTAVGICSRWAMAPSNASSLVVRRTTGRGFAAAMCDIALTLSSSEWWLIITPCGRTSAQRRVAQTIAVALGTRTFGFPVEPEVY